MAKGRDKQKGSQQLYNCLTTVMQSSKFAEHTRREVKQMNKARKEKINMTLNASQPSQVRQSTLPSCHPPSPDR
ncbi:hypothetical protein E2C01_098192 [Portunus trituberculatus]|uniref:Uncharacterized protein n=1 Tax=Portunus trituberculatus TaxID=210409 RepID=A0A5B7KCA1_PORTR|nr:hypothetical protein [Portunus trituberculatus]